MTLETEVGNDLRFKLHQDEREFRIVYAGIFTISLVAALFSRLTPWRRQRSGRRTWPRIWLRRRSKRRRRPSQTRRTAGATSS